MGRIRTVLAFLFSVVVFGTVAVAAALSLGLLAIPLASSWPGWWGRACLWIAGVEAEFSGLEHLRGPGTRVLVANHTSALDVPLVAALSPQAPLCLAKKELQWFPVFNLVWWSHGQVFVDRRDPARAAASLADVVARCAASPRTIVLAPEGTRSRDGKLGRFKLGAFRLAVATGSPIVPVVVRGAGQLMPPGQWFTRPGRVTVQVMPPVDSSGWTETSLKAAAAALEDDYRRWLEG
ncbi:MAG: 1-acyl-sn-glycerol-3-phosphate acyltransferase [Deltaproteobacteria bacterium]|nr:1-acyl-sn-glycerol-3-phosphate acyltransferase [Deltaproteobacteria bacterium]